MTRTLALTVMLSLVGFARLHSDYVASGQGDSKASLDGARYIQLSLLPESLGAVYTEGLHPEVLHWIYPDEPVVVQLTLSNRSGESLDIPRQPREWFEAARLRLVERTPGQRTPADKPFEIELPRRLLRRDRVGPTSLAPDVLRLDTGSAETVRLEVDRRGSFDVHPGVYALSVLLDNGFPVSNQARQLLRDERLVGVRVIESRADVMNHAAHLAMWATLANDFAAARRWLRELLSVNPGSSVAYAQMGNVAQAEGMCKEAVSNWRKAIEILAANSDTEARDLGRIGREDGIQRLKEKTQRCE
jgi:hypothetical protein